jgi:hypothetical protein
VRFTIRKSIGEMYVLSKHNEAPIKVLPPYLFMSADQTEITVDVCNMDEGKQYLVREHRMWMSAMFELNEPLFCAVTGIFGRNGMRRL